MVTLGQIQGYYRKNFEAGEKLYDSQRIYQLLMNLSSIDIQQQVVIMHLWIIHALLALLLSLADCPIQLLHLFAIQTYPSCYMLAAMVKNICWQSKQYLIKIKYQVKHRLIILRCIFLFLIIMDSFCFLWVTVSLSLRLVY